MNQVITIDGPAASGKSSVSRELARILGWNWVSTGAFYRGLALIAQRENVDLQNEAQLAALAQSRVWSVVMNADNTAVFHGNLDVTADVNKEQVGTIASKISQYPAVRSALLAAQRGCFQNSLKDGRGLVAEGRDCGTVVFPQAPLKVYLTARAEDRAARRAQEEGTCLQTTIDAQKERDAQDSGRVSAPLQIPQDAIVIDTSQLNLAEVVDKILEEARPIFSLAKT